MGGSWAVRVLQEIKDGGCMLNEVAKNAQSHPEQYAFTIYLALLLLVP